MNRSPALVAAALVLASVPALPAQSVRGSVVDIGGIPVPGVVVLLLAPDSSVAGRALSATDGTFHVAATAAGTYRLQTLRIGFRPVQSPAIALATGGEVSQRVVISALPSGLDTVRIGGRNVCGRASATAAATASAWEQVRAAVTAADLTAQGRQVMATRLNYERRLDNVGWRTLQQRTEVRTETLTQPWSAPTPASLHEQGYITVGLDSTAYRAPGLDMLGSTQFIDDHCFRLTSGRDRATIGIAFEPVPDRRKVADIRGTIFVDRATSELRTMEFRYSYPEVPDLADGARGSMDFVRLRNGAWAISRWEIRMPVRELRVAGAGARVGYVGGAETRVVTTGVRVAGGELALAMSRGDTLFARPPLVVRGEVRDSLSGRPVGGARVALLGTTQSAVADGDGRFAIPDALPGEYLLEIRTASLDSLDTASQLPISVTTSPDPVRVRVPSGSLIAASLCGPRAQGATRIPGMVFGTVVVPDGSAPPASSRVVAEWNDRESGEARRRVMPVAPDGRFGTCDAPLATAIRLIAGADSVSADPATVVLAPEMPIAQVQFVLDREIGAPATFGGTVSDSSGVPLDGAEVMLPELARSVMTDARGTFRLRDVRPGTHRVVVRKVGFGPLDATLGFAPNDDVERRIVLPRVTTLAEVRVTATDRRLAEFDENRKLGLGHFITRDFLETQGPRPLSEVLGGVNGVLLSRDAVTVGARPGIFVATRRKCVMNLRTFGESGEPSSGLQTCDPCYAQVFVDGMLMTRADRFDINTYPLREIQAIEYYASAAVVPGRYHVNGAACGVVVIHTRSGP